MKLGAGNKYLGALAASAAMVVFWCIWFIGLQMARLICGPNRYDDMVSDMAGLFAVVLAGFTVGVVFGSSLKLWQTVISSAVFGVLSSIPIILLTEPGDMAVGLLATLVLTPAGAALSANRGIRLRRERKWTHLLWLLSILAVLISTYYATIFTSNTLNSH